MKVVIAGSRTIRDYEAVARAIKLSGWEITEVVSGTAKGVANYVEMWGEINSVPIKKFPADWDKYGKAAGPIRNAAMAEYADAAIVLIENKSTGATNMVAQMKKRNKPCIMVPIKE
jgi:hypothetical protein